MDVTHQQTLVFLVPLHVFLVVLNHLQQRHEPMSDRCAESKLEITDARETDLPF